MVDDRLRSQQTDDAISDFVAAMAEMPDAPIATETVAEAEAADMAVAIMESETSLMDQRGDRLPAEGRFGHLVETVRSMEPRLERGEAAAWPEREIRCDRNHIDGQRIVVINAENIHKTFCSLKLSEQDFRRVFEHMTETQETMAGIPVDRTGFVYRSNQYGAKNRRRQATDDCYLCDAWSFTRTNEEGQSMQVFVADPYSVHDIERREGDEVRSAIGMIRMETDDAMSPDEMERMLGQITAEDLGVPDALEEVSAEAEQDYKIAKYAWQQQATPFTLTEVEREEARKMRLEEVADGYQTYVLEGRGERLRQKYGDFVLTHLLYGGFGKTMEEQAQTMAKSLKRTFEEGLNSTEERYGRGVIFSGQSSDADLVTGGAASVFTRIMTKDVLPLTDPGVVLLLKPELMDRVDYYCYLSDQFGATYEDTMKGRLAPDMIMQILGSKSLEDEYDPQKRAAAWMYRQQTYPFHNEVMFHAGIGPQYIQGVMVPNARFGRQLIAALRAMGVEGLNGIALENLIVNREDLDEELAIQSAEMGELLNAGYPEEEDFFDNDMDDWDDLDSFDAMLDKMAENGDGWNEW